MAARLTDAADVKAAATALRMRLEQERDSNVASRLAQAYAVVAGTLVDRADAQNRPVQIAEVLTLAGHPFINAPSPLLDALKPASKQYFNNDLGAAVRWATQTYGIKPEQLRPPPLARSP